MIAILIALSVVPNYSGARAIASEDAVACQSSYRDLQEYQGRAYGVVERRGVDYPSGYIEYSDSVIIRNELEVAAKPYLQRLRIEIFYLSSAECKMISNRGKDAINRVIVRVFR